MNYSVSLSDWISCLNSLTKKNLIYAPIQEGQNIDFKLIKDNADEIIYNSAKTLTPLKHFFFSIKEKVTEIPVSKKVILIGAKGCDLAAIDLLEKVFLDPDYPDPFYNSRKENTLIIGTDCYDINETCHCTAYNINPYAEKNCDLIINLIDNNIIISDASDKGKDFIESIQKELSLEEAQKAFLQKMARQQLSIKNKVKSQARGIPDSKKTAQIINKSIDRKDRVWKKYASNCVSCGACVISCPTCHCFLLVDLPGTKMDKLRTHDACQYPGFERVAAGVDPLEKHFVRFRNRYICKWINRPEKYNEIACTGCGRCIDTCIGKIDKNEVIRALK